MILPSRFLPVKLSGLALACAIFVPALPAPPVLAQDEADAAQEQPFDLREAVEDFWHYGKIARYDLAAEQGRRILGQSEQPVAVLEAFEAVAGERNDNLDEWLLRWQRVDAMKDVATQLIQFLNQGHKERRSDPAYVQQNIERLNVNERAYQLGIGRLRNSGELAVPMMIDYLRDPAKKAHHPAIRRGLRDMGRSALNSLIVALQMKDVETRIEIISALGDIGYEIAVPYLARLANDPQEPNTVRQAAAESLARMGAGRPQDLNPAELFFSLAERFYYDNAAVTADSRANVGYVWYWNEQKGLQKKEVPGEIFNEIMAMRTAEQTLEVDPSMGKALSLWLASNYKREAELPEGGTDPTRAEGQPDAHYYGVVAGAQHLNEALSRALRDNNSAVAMKVVRSQQEIVGQSNLFAGGGAPLIDAMQYPDRRVRFEAAFAIAGALPQKTFQGQDMVVPLLAEAVAQTGTPGVLVVASEEQLNALVQAINDMGYNATGASSADAAVGTGSALPAVDLILINGDIQDSEIGQLLMLTGRNSRLAGASKLIIAEPGSQWYVRAGQDPLINATAARDPQALQAEIESARQRAGSLPMEAEEATQYALRSSELLEQLAISRGQVLDLSPANTALLGALADARPELVMAAGEVLALFNGSQAQSSLLAQAAEEATADEVKISLFNSLARNAKFFGNQLESAQVQTLQDAVAGAENLEVRAAAAEAAGALNLPSDQARRLIVTKPQAAPEQPEE